MPSFEFGFEENGDRFLEKGFSVSKFTHLPFTEVRQISLEPPIDVRNHLNETQRCTFCASFTADFCNTETFLPWLHEDLIRRGVEFVYKPVASLAEVLELGVPVVFNCLGFESGELFPDVTLYHVRGQSMFVGSSSLEPPFFGIASGHHAVFKHRQGYYIGSYFLEGEPVVRTIPSEVEYRLSLDFVGGAYRELCSRLGFAIPTIDFDQIRRVNTGLRPYRQDGPRVEADEVVVPKGGHGSHRVRVVHNYGHGAHGWTVGYATAEDAVNLAEVRGWLRYASAT